MSTAETETAEETKRLAAQILELEEVHQQSGLNEDQTSKWRSLVCLLLMRLCPSSERRKDLRVPSNIKTSLRKDDQVCNATIVDIHRTGLAITGTLADLGEGDNVKLQSFQVDETTHYTDVPGRIVRKKMKDGNEVAAIELAENGTDARQRFFDVAFYPSYVQYLKDLAGHD